MSRLDIRLPVEMKELVQRAAELSGLTVTDFVRSCACASAQDALLKHNRIELSQEAMKAFLALLETDAKPSPTALRAAQRYRREQLGLAE